MKALIAIYLGLAGLLGCPSLVRGDAIDGTWQANAGLSRVVALSVTEVSDAQGIFHHRGNYYLFGETKRAGVACGVVVELDRGLKPTGKSLDLRYLKKNLLIHPTGITYSPRWGIVIGNTWNQRGTIYRLNWNRAWRDGNLDHALIAVVIDDAAENGTRPEFVSVRGREYLASADYGAVKPALRLYDPGKIFRAKHTLGAVIKSLPAGPFTQSLRWQPEQGRLTFVQNVVAGRGWRLDSIDLTRAVDGESLSAPGARLERKTFLQHGELEAWYPLSSHRELFITSSDRENLVIGRPVSIPVTPSSPGDRRFLPVGEPSRRR